MRACEKFLKLGMLEPSDDFKWDHSHVVAEKLELKFSRKQDIDRET
jgi:hypothetical protein